MLTGGYFWGRLCGDPTPLERILFWWMGLVCRLLISVKDMRLVAGWGLF